jgi:probable rRNA maturation factor
MILLDPDLASDAAPKPTSASRSLRSVPFARALSRSLTRFLAKAKAAICPRGQVTVLLTTDAALRDLNRRFRGKDMPTDVLSFPANPLQSAKPAERVAGDLAISVETARRQGTEYGHSLSTELKILILHGVLHLAGYDHDSDVGQMHRRERDLRARLGLPLGLIERASRRESTRITQSGVRKGGRNPGTAPCARTRRPAGPARGSAPSTRSRAR